MPAAQLRLRRLLSQRHHPGPSALAHAAAALALLAAALAAAALAAAAHAAAAVTAALTATAFAPTADGLHGQPRSQLQGVLCRG